MSVGFNGEYIFRSYFRHWWIDRGSNGRVFEIVEYGQCRIVISEIYRYCALEIKGVMIYNYDIFVQDVVCDRRQVDAAGFF